MLGWEKEEGGAGKCGEECETIRGKKGGVTIYNPSSSDPNPPTPTPLDPNSLDPNPRPRPHLKSFTLKLSFDLNFLRKKAVKPRRIKMHPAARYTLQRDRPV